MSEVGFEPSNVVTDLSVRPSSFLQYELNTYAAMYLGIYVQGFYDRLLILDMSRTAGQKTRCDIKAEIRLKQRPGARQQIAYALEREIRMVEQRIEDLTRVTPFTPEYKFLGMPETMPPPRVEELSGLNLLSTKDSPVSPLNRTACDWLAALANRIEVPTVGPAHHAHMTLPGGFCFWPTAGKAVDAQVHELCLAAAEDAMPRRRRYANQVARSHREPLAGASGRVSTNLQFANPRNHVEDLFGVVVDMQRRGLARLQRHQERLGRLGL
jgi:hypothetical protein